LPVALERGLVTIDEIDECVLRVLRLKERLGLFDDPYRRGSKAEEAETIAARRRLAREAATKSLVLAKNSGGTLPFRKDLRRGSRDWAACQRVARNARPVGRCRLRGAKRHGARGATRGAAERGDRARGRHGDLRRGRFGHRRGAELVAGADVVVLCLGEAAEMSGEAASRSSPELPGEQRALAEAVLERAARDKVPVVVVLFSGRPLIVSRLMERADALLIAWFPGTEAGNAIADVLTGRASPSGRTPITWPRALGQIPIFYSQRNSGRPENPKDHFTSKYLDVPNSPLLPFGFGLSYGCFSYANLTVSPEVVTASDTIEVSVEVTNEGARAAEETVFLFIRDRVASVARPLLELKGFAKVSLAGRSDQYRATAAAGRGAALLGPRLRAGARARRNRDPRRAVCRQRAA
jgi:beta-glucosidase